MRMIHYLLVSCFVSCFSLVDGLGQQNCCEEAYQASRTTRNWKFKSADERKCAEAEAEATLRAGNKELAAQCLVVLALDDVENNRFESAFQYLALLQEALPADKPEYEPYLANAYGLLAYVYDQQGYQKSAVQYYRRAIELYEKHHMQGEQVGEQANLVKLLAQQGNFEEAIHIGMAAHDLVRNIPPFQRSLELRGVAANNLGFAYNLQAGNYRADMRVRDMHAAGEKALEVFKDNLPTARILGGLPHAIALLNIASMAMVVDHLDTSRHYLQIYLDSVARGMPPGAQYYSLSAAIHAKKGDFEAAFLDIGKACSGANLVAPAADLLGPVALRIPDSGDWMQQAALWMHVLQQKGAVLFFYYLKHPDQPEFLEKSLIAYEQAVEVFNRLQADMYEGSSVSELRARFYAVYLGAARAAALLFLKTDTALTDKRETYWRKAYEYAEQTQGFSLRQGAMNALEGKCDTLNTYALHCRDKVFRDLLFHARTKAKNARAEKKFRDEYHQFRESLKNSNNPAERQYYEQRFGNAVPDIADIQTNLLPDNALFIEYVWSAPQPFALWATRNSMGLVLLDIPDGDRFWADVERFKQNWLRKDEGYIDVALGHGLYKILIQKVWSDLPAAEQKALNRLVIVADNLLLNLPFDVLPMSDAPVKEHAHPYLLHKYTVGYQYSAALWALQSKRTEKSTRAPISAAVFVHASGGLSCSPDNLPEMKKIAEKGFEKTAKTAKIHPKTFADATETDFMNHAASVDLLFFCMHGCLDKDPDKSYLSFAPLEKSGADGRLSVSEFYALPEPLEARLAVFGSCETARQGGEHEAGTKGEGVLGLHRAISYAGCPNVVATLNPVVDKYAAKLLDLFFDNLLLKKMPADLALTTAKRQYLDQATKPGSDLLPHPIYWSNFICIGPPVQFR